MGSVRSVGMKVNKKAMFWSIVLSVFVLLVAGAVFWLVWVLPPEIVMWSSAILVFLSIFYFFVKTWYKVLTK